MGLEKKKIVRKAKVTTDTVEIVEKTNIQQRIIDAVGEQNYCYLSPSYLSFVWGTPNDSSEMHVYHRSSSQREMHADQSHHPHRFLCCEGKTTAYKKPVGLVIEGELEVTEKFEVKIGSLKIHRIRTTAIIKKNQYFGLFESFANLRGDWRIRAGVANIYIANRLGDIKLWKKFGLATNSTNSIEKIFQRYAGRESAREIEATLKHKAEATFDFSKFFTFAVDKYTQINKKSVKILVFDADKINDLSLLSELQLQTIQQLTSVLYQNAVANSILDLSKIKSIDTLQHKKAYATLVSILRGHIPILEPIENHELHTTTFAALTEVYKAIDEDADGSLNWRIFRPAYFSISKPCVLINNLDQRVDLDDIDNMIKGLHSLRQPVNLSSLDLEIIEIKNVEKLTDSYWARVKIDGHEIGLYRTKMTLDKSIKINSIFGPNAGMDIDEWSKPLNDVLFFVPLPFFPKFDKSTHA